MTSRSATSVSCAAAQQPLISPMAWGWIAVLGSLFVVLHVNFFWRMVQIASGDPDWQHALIVPLISAYFIYQYRDRLLATPRRPSVVGLIILFVGIFGFAFWIYPGRNDMFQGYCMILGLFGLAWLVLGHRMMRLLWFPIAYLVFAVKVSDRIWNQISWKLQDIAASAAAVLLKILGLALDMDVSLSGNTIEIWNGAKKLPPVNVAEACSGLRMLMAFVALGVAMAFLSNRAWWQRLTMVILTVPVALLVNIGRVTTISILYAKVDERFIHGDLHIFIGLLMLIPAAGIFWFIGWVMDNLVIADEAGAAEPAPRSASAPAAAGVEASRSEHLDLHRLVWVIGKGLATGAVLAAAAGSTYGLLLLSFNPGRFFPWLSQLAALALLGASLLILVAAGWHFRRHAGRPSGSQAALATGAGVLLVSILGLNGVLMATKTVLFKEKIPLRHRLTKIPKQVETRGTAPMVWTMEGEDRRLPKDQEDILGTTNYISRYYKGAAVDSKKKSFGLKLHVAYYTGTIDTVPHVPERCITAGGALPVGSGVQETTLQMQGDHFKTSENGILVSSRLCPEGTHIPNTKITATRFSYTLAEGQHGGGGGHVFYFFKANGKFLPNPDRVRALAFDPRDRYSYYCKIEVLLPGVGDLEVAARQAESFLSVMLPEILACLPDWVDVKSGQYPQQASKRI